MTVDVTYPPGPITPRGARMLLDGIHPSLAYRSFNDAIATWLMGPFAPVPGVQNGVTVDGPKNIIPTWQMQDQQGANQDGVDFNGSVLQPIEFDMVAEAHGNTPAETRAVIRDWIDGWSEEHEGELEWATPDGGMWWAKARWLKTPTDALRAATSCRQKFTWTARIDTGCWRGLDSVSLWAPEYRQVFDEFNTDYDPGWGPNWDLSYDGTGGGEAYVEDGQAKWRDDPDDPFFTNARQVIARRNNWLSADDNQVVEIEFGSTPEMTFGVTAQNSILGRMANTGTIGATCIQVRIQRTVVILEAVVAGVSREIGRAILLWPPIRGEKFTLVCGYNGQPRRFRVMRGRHQIIDAKETGTFSQLGSAFRRAGMGMRAGTAVISQATPARIRVWSAGTNTAVTQSGQLFLTNFGDRDEWFRLTVFGPGTFEFGNGGDASKMIKFGPLEDGQAVQIRTEQRLRGVVDFSRIPAGTTQAENLQKAINELSTYAGATGNLAPLLEQFESAFGDVPPQGELYRLLEGRFSNKIPMKPPGRPAVETPIAVKVTGGNANTKVVAALTPRRRWPL